jgi:hypothetical protein
MFTILVGSTERKNGKMPETGGTYDGVEMHAIL